VTSWGFFDNHIGLFYVTNNYEKFEEKRRKRLTYVVAALQYWYKQQKKLNIHTKLAVYGEFLLQNIMLRDFYTKDEPYRLSK